MQALLAADQKAAMNPDIETPFADATDAVRRLLPFHVFHHPQEELEYAITAARKHDLFKGKGKARELDVPSHLQGLVLENRGECGDRLCQSIELMPRGCCFRD